MSPRPRDESNCWPARKARVECVTGFQPPSAVFARSAGRERQPQLLEDLLNGLYDVHPDMTADLVTCYAGRRPSSMPRAGKSIGWAIIPDPAARQQLYSPSSPPTATTSLGIICSAEPIMTKWKWMLALRAARQSFYPE